MDPAVSYTLRFSLALLFMAAAIHKARDPVTFRAALTRYEILPESCVRPVALGLTVAEAFLVILLILPDTSTLGAAGAGMILVIYSGAIAFNLSRGRSEIDCGCGGISGTRRLGASLLWRNGLLLVGCALAALPVTPRSLVLLDGATICFAVTTLCLAYYAAGLLAETHSAPFQRRISR